MYKQRIVFVIEVSSIKRLGMRTGFMSYQHSQCVQAYFHSEAYGDTMAYMRLHIYVCGNVNPNEKHTCTWPYITWTTLNCYLFIYQQWALLTYVHNARVSMTCSYPCAVISITCSVYMPLRRQIGWLLCIFSLTHCVYLTTTMAVCLTIVRVINCKFCTYIFGHTFCLHCNLVKSSSRILPFLYLRPNA